MREFLIVLAIIGSIGCGAFEGNKAWMRSIELHDRCHVCGRLLAKHRGLDLCTGEGCFKGFPSRREVEGDERLEPGNEQRNDFEDAEDCRTRIEEPDRT